MSAWALQWCLGLIGCSAFWLLFRCAGLMHLGLAVYAGLGAYAAVAWMNISHFYQWPLGFQLMCLPMISVAVSWSFHRLMAPFLLQGSGVVFAMLSLAWGEVLYLWALAFPSFSGGEEGWSFSRQHLTHQDVMLYALLAVILIMVAWQRFQKSHWRLWWATHRDREERLVLWGIEARLLRYQAHGIAACLLGLYGGLLALSLEHVSVDMFDPMLSAWLLLFGWLGGRSVWGLCLSVTLWAFFKTSVGTVTSYGPFYLGLLVIILTWTRAYGLKPRFLMRFKEGFKKRFKKPLSPMTSPSVIHALPHQLSLKVDQLSVIMDQFPILTSISFELSPCQRMGIWGINGAGKSTLLKAIMGEHAAYTQGRVIWGDQDISTWSVLQRAQSGMTRSFQLPYLMNDMTVKAHIEMVISARGHREGAFSSFQTCQAELSYWLHQLNALDKADQKASQLSYADQRLLECALTAIYQPRLALLDEPTAGLNQQERHQLAQKIPQWFSQASCLIIEHDREVLEKIADIIIEIKPCSS